MSIFRNNSSKKPWWIILLGMLVSITLVFTGTVGASTTAQASETGPSITVTGKYCPKASSSWSRTMKISDKAKAKSTICITKTNDGSLGVSLNATTNFTKVNDSRFKAAIKITPYKYAHHVSTDGLHEYEVWAYADSAYLSGQGRYYMDERGLAWYDNVPGKRFTLSVRWWVETKTRVWNNDLAQFVTSTDQGYFTMKSMKFAVTKTK